MHAWHLDSTFCNDLREGAMAEGGDSDDMQPRSMATSQILPKIVHEKRVNADTRRKSGSKNPPLGG